MTDHPPLDRWRLDDLVAGPEKLWGLDNIARVLGVSVSTARRWAKRPEVPIYRPAGTDAYFSFRSELLAWLRSRA